jgi:hypothetical protein
MLRFNNVNLNMEDTMKRMSNRLIRERNQLLDEAAQVARKFSDEAADAIQAMKQPEIS